MNLARQLGRLAIGSAVVAATGLATPTIAQADGMPSRGRAVVYEKPYDWGGFYFGAHSGWAWADINSQFVAAPSQGDSVSHDAPMVGGQIGIQHQFGNFVLGVEGNLSVAIQDNFANVECPNNARTCGKRFDDVITVGPRLGWAMGKWMPYLTGGFASASFTHRSVDTGTQANPQLGRERFEGWYIGGGVDMALSHGWTIGLEYRHYEFGDEDILPFTAGGVAVPANLRTIDPSLDTVSLRVSWKLGRPEAKPLK
jgi:opacity protein-like surface antigen